MAQIPYRANLSAAIFPMTLARAGRSVIVPQADQNFDRRVDPQGEQKSAGIPQIIYGENILPTADGYQSVGYETGANFGPIAPGFNWSIITVNAPFAQAKSVTLAVGVNEVRLVDTGASVPITGTPPVGPLNFVSTATVRGVCYLHVGNQIYTYTNVGLTNITATFTPVGILTNLVNICGAFNYLILLKSDGTINWSSTTTPTDFTPSLVSGAGSGAIVGNLGTTLYLRQNPTGFYVYCRGNVINVAYTGNNRYPWRFTPIPDSEGISTDGQIAGDSTDSRNFILSNAGAIYEIAPTSASLIAPELSEVLTRMNYADEFNYTTNTFTVAATSYFLTGARISVVLNRFIFVTNPVRGIAIVYDISLQRYGRLKVAHSHVIDTDATAGAAARDIVFVDSAAGITRIMEQDINNSAVSMQGVLVLGKFQYARSRFLCLDEVSIESAQLSSLVSPSNRNFSVLAIPTLDGKTFQTAQPLYEVIDSSTGAVMSYNSTAEGRNVSLLIKGAFDLTSVELMFHLGGDC